MNECEKSINLEGKVHPEMLPLFTCPHDVPTQNVKTVFHTKKDKKQIKSS